jgi:hypothetical protein
METAISNIPEGSPSTEIIEMCYLQSMKPSPLEKLTAEGSF